ncbi:hypothetical protein [Rhodococcus sp. NPDC003348]
MQWIVWALRAWLAVSMVTAVVFGRVIPGTRPARDLAAARLRGRRAAGRAD